MSPKLSELIQQAETLSLEEQLQLIAHFKKKLDAATESSEPAAETTGEALLNLFDSAIADYLCDQPTPTDISSVLHTALQTFLAERGYLASQKRLHITPASQGSGYSDTSIHHDQVLSNVHQNPSA